MKQSLLLLALAGLVRTAAAQTSITASDMPVAGDTLRWSSDVAAAATISTGSGGAAQVWDYSALQASAQGLDQYQTAGQINLLYAATISPFAYGYKVGDSLPGLGSTAFIQVSDVYSFFEKKSGPSRYLQSAFAANFNGIPTPANYSNDDELYFFPLTFGNADTSSYRLTITLPTIGAIKISGTRTTEADGWGTITTPFFTDPVSCLRVRSSIEEVDSVSFGPVNIGLPRQAVEYKWLTNESHYPALIISANILAGNEVPSGVRYRDTYRSLSVSNNARNKTASLSIAPNPAQGETVNLTLPSHWSNGCQVEVYDATGKLVVSQSGNAAIRVSSLPSGTYLVRAWAGSEVGFASFVR